MIPGEIRVKKTDIEINPNSPETVIEVKNVGDRPIQIG
ncbi:urease subunit beta, partial [Staphylococcus epidermidis]